MKKGFLLLLSLIAGIGLFAQAIVVNNNGNYKNPFWLAKNVLVDSNFTIFQPFNQNGIPITQPNTNQVGIFGAFGTGFPIDTGIVMCAYSVQDVLVGTSGTNPNSGPFVDPWLSSVLAAIGSSGYNINDRVQIIFSFIATSDSIEFNYVFGSHEYPTYTCSSFNDVFGFFLKGYDINGNQNLDSVNLATIPNTSVPVAINTINQGYPGSAGSSSNCLSANPNYVAHSVMYNSGNASITSLGGYTTKFTAKAQVKCGNFYTIRLALSNVSDHILSSAVFLEANSFKSPSINISSNLNSGNSFIDSTVIEGCAPSYMVFEKDGNKNVGMGIKMTYSGNAINGVDVVQMPDSIWIPPGSTKDSLLIQAIDDGIPEPNDSLVITMLPVETECFDYPPQQVVFHLRDRKVLTPVAQASGTDTIYCPGDTANLEGLISGNEGIYVGWWSDDSTAASTRTVSPLATTTYYYNAIDECSSDTISDSVTIYLSDYDPMTYNVDTVQVCRGDTASFVLDVQDGRPPYFITWPDGTNNTWFSAVPTNDTTYYTFNVWDACGVQIQDSMMAIIAPDAIASFSYLNDYAIPLRVQFTNQSSNQNTWVWDFGDGTTSTDLNPIHDFPAPGTYSVTLSIVTADGCTDLIVLEVVVETDFYLYVPTAFTPDGDGINECFEVKGVGFDSFEMKVFDRWGNQVFYTDNIDECWDGTMNGNMAPQGTYTYHIFLRLPFEKIHQRQGMVTLYR